MVNLEKNKGEKMKNKIKIIIVIMMVSISFGLCSNAIVKTTIKTPTTTIKTQAIQQPTKEINPTYETANAVDVVANPKKYLNKHITLKGTFDKFSILGLDYKPAFRSSEKYITFFIKRDDSVNKLVPLSEM